MSTKAIKSLSTKVPLYKLRRMAQRGTRVIQRHAPTSVPVSVLATTAVPLFEEFNQLYDESMVKGPTRGIELLEGREAVAELSAVTSSWRGHLVRDIPGLSSEDYSAGSRTPDDVIADAKRMIALVEEQASGPSPLAYANELIASLAAALEKAEEQWGEAQDALGDHQERQAKLRQLGAQVQKELVALRTTLRTVIGSSHRDYQKLRLERATTPDVEDDVMASSDGALTPEVTDAEDAAE